MSPILHIRHHKRFPQLLHIGSRTRSPGSLPAPHSTRCPYVSFAPPYVPSKRDRHHLIPQQRHHPSHRPHKSFRLARPPVHVLRPIDPRQLLWAAPLANHLSPQSLPTFTDRQQPTILALRPYSPASARKPQPRTSSQTPRPPVPAARLCRRALPLDPSPLPP